MAYLDYILLMIALVAGIKIHYWATISRQGFQSETPELFLKYPSLYIIANIVFFLLILIFTEISWYIIIISFILSIFIGGMLAGKKYKEITKEMQENKVK